MKIVLGVAGGIAAYKVCSVLRGLKELGHSVRVVPTQAALKFVGAATWEALSGQPVATDVFDSVDEVQHVAVGHSAQLMVVAPATADVIARAAAGLADDMLTATLLTTTCPVVFVPAMHTEMWLHPATVANVALLRSRGITVMEPASGRLTGADSGLGRLPEADEIVRFVLEAAGQAKPGLLAGSRVLISAGGTREPLDPVRFLGNRSSGKQGVALAEAAQAMGAQVTLIAANVDRCVLAGLPGEVTVSQVETTEELRQACLREGERTELIIMAAAVADYRPETVAEHKIKKTDESGMTLTLIQNPDILHELVEAYGMKATVVGFAAETGSPDDTPEELAKAKLIRKGCHALVLNSVAGGAVFGQDTTEVRVFERVGMTAVERAQARGTKADVSRVVMESVAKLRHS